MKYLIISLFLLMGCKRNYEYNVFITDKSFPVDNCYMNNNTLAYQENNTWTYRKCMECFCIIEKMED